MMALNAKGRWLDLHLLDMVMVWHFYIVDITCHLSAHVSTLPRYTAC